MTNAADLGVAGGAVLSGNPYVFAFSLGWSIGRSADTLTGGWFSDRGADGLDVIMPDRLTNWLRDRAHRKMMDRYNSNTRKKIRGDKLRRDAAKIAPFTSPFGGFAGLLMDPPPSLPKPPKPSGGLAPKIEP